MRVLLAKFGPTVQDTAAGADFILHGTVKLVPIPGDQQRVEIQWSVATPAGDERGRVVQLNNVPAGSLNGYWGDVATAVAQEAAGGVRDVILRQSGHSPGTEAAAKSASGATPGPATGTATHAAPQGSSAPRAPVSP
jgi:hypothetical protein